MKILTSWLRSYLPSLSVSDRQLADDLTLRGIAVEGVHDLGEGNGHLFEMDITTNRVDAMNHYGIAREAATIYNLPLAPLETALPVAVAAARTFPVRIEAPELCGRFTARVLRGVTIAPSAGRVAEYFNLLGQKQILNAVDASNFVLMGMGHPTHAFDLDKIEGGIVVRLARKGEKLRLLDGAERTLEADDLVVADEKKALALAGVMGGWDSMITAETKNILVEAAWFDPASIRRSSRRHMLHTDASHRFERGADFNAAPVANALVSRLILESGGQVEGELVDVVIPAAAAKTADRMPIALSVRQVQRHLGTTIAAEGITKEIVAQYLAALGCELTATGGDTFAAKLPSWRLDLEREIDLIEEVARVYGYNGFANTLPTPGIVIAHPAAAAEAAVRERLLALGFSESISSTFASQAESDLFAATGKGTVAMENPLSEEAALLRPSLVPGMLTMLAHNLNRDVQTVRLFEQGAIFTGGTDEVVESASLSLGLTGAVAASPLHSAQDAPVFELKGVIESLLSLFACGEVAFTADAPVWLQAGRSATALLNGEPVARFGELSASETARRKLRQPIYLAQIDLDKLYAIPLRQVTAREISRFQAVERDFSFTFSDSMQWQTIAAAIRALGIPELQRLAPTEIFRDAKGKSVPPGYYAILLKCVFQSNERTLREDELTTWWSNIIATLTKLGGTIRAPGL
ncbi:MAG TPA: phenylalanine--tRNA ligase subunit beta [Edaphobacter sp.]|uniref:phenylalanine--tRNA ligase subunit beta n=1 Tax=Edaphobacter sp. TaxID=1934404 RepID=UPI002B685062|nr:phenylalanine--tRNA ligase subunit beta [Edaphobacter sp.]HUZ93773.1 phenylalanine--tRNA ligase subunit beta [Edaphobacter sp.]